MSLNVTACRDNMIQYMCANVVLYSVGFATGEGVIVVGGFYNKVARESSFAIMSLGTLPKAAFPVPNQNLKVGQPTQSNI